MSQRLNITIPDDLHRRLEAHRNRLNISAVCAAALAEEVGRLEALFADTTAESIIPALSEDDVERIVRRLGNEKQQSARFWYRAGAEYGLEWAKRDASEPTLRWLVDRASRGESLRHITGGSAGALTAAGDALREFAAFERQTVRTLRGPGVPRYDTDAFEAGVTAAATTVWREVADRLKPHSHGTSAAEESGIGGDPLRIQQSGNQEDALP